MSFLRSSGTEGRLPGSLIQGLHLATYGVGVRRKRRLIEIRLGTRLRVEVARERHPVPVRRTAALLAEHVPRRKDVRREARRLGLPVTDASADEEPLLWDIAQWCQSPMHRRDELSSRVWAAGIPVNPVRRNKW